MRACASQYQRLTSPRVHQRPIVPISVGATDLFGQRSGLTNNEQLRVGTGVAFSEKAEFVGMESKNIIIGSTAACYQNLQNLIAGSNLGLRRRNFGLSELARRRMSGGGYSSVGSRNNASTADSCAIASLCALSVSEDGRGSAVKCIWSGSQRCRAWGGSDSARRWRR